MFAAYFVLMLVVAASAKEDNASQELCGRQLADAISLLCSAARKPGPLKDAMVAYVQYLQTTQAESLIEVPEMAVHKTWPWLSDESSNDVTSPSWSKLPGLVEECCNKPCNLHQLLNYC